MISTIGTGWSVTLQPQAYWCTPLSCWSQLGKYWVHTCWGTPSLLILNNLLLRTKTKLMNGQIQVAGNQWLLFLYANYTYDAEDPWNGLLHSGLLISVSLLNSHPIDVIVTIVSRPLSISSFHQVQSTKNQKWHNLGMHAFMVCMPLPRCHLPKLQLRYVQLLMLIMSDLLKSFGECRPAFPSHLLKCFLKLTMWLIQSISTIVFSSSWMILMRRTKLSSWWHGEIGKKFYNLLEYLLTNTCRQVFPLLRRPKANLGQTTTCETLRGRGMGRTWLFECKPKESLNGEPLGAGLQTIYTTIHEGCTRLSVGLCTVHTYAMTSWWS